MQTPSSTPESGASGQGGGSPSPGSAAEAVLSGVAREFYNFLADVEDLVKAATSLTGDDLARAKAKLGERVALAKASVEQMGGAFAQQARKAATVTNDYVHEQPWQMIGAGAALGFLLGVVLARRPGPAPQ
jgi:ElaB/YqjD/DUF883 family membrane-anchored ribosome-binding protein